MRRVRRGALRGTGRPASELAPGERTGRTISDFLGRCIAGIQSALHRHCVQNGFTTTKITTTIVVKLGISFSKRQVRPFLSP